MHSYSCRKEDSTIETKTLFDKDGLLIQKNNGATQQTYDIHFFLENQTMNLISLMNFDLVKLLYALNNDIYEQTTVENVKENEAIITVVVKNLFEEIGLPQYYYYLNMKKICMENQYIFESHSIRDKVPHSVVLPDNSELLDIEKFSIRASVFTPHKIHFSLSIVFNSETSASLILSSFSDKLLVIILQKIYKRLKQFIEKT
jgi:hypothetical protein